MHQKLSRALENKYRFKPYSKAFVRHFFAQKRALGKVLKSISKKEIHHIGSTSVPNLGGKGIIDIIVVVPKTSFKKSRALLEQSGYTYDHTLHGVRSFFTKYYLTKKHAPRLIHLHLTFHHSGEIEKALSFREYLCAHPRVRLQYAKIKKAASKKHAKNAKKYVRFKLHFVESTLQKALVWYKKRIDY